MILLASQSQWFAHKLNMFSDQREDQPKGHTRHEMTALRAAGPSGTTDFKQVLRKCSPLLRETV